MSQVKVPLRSSAVVARAIAEKNSIRVHPELFDQFMSFRRGEFSRTKEDITLGAVNRWVETYDRTFNQMVHVRRRKQANHGDSDE